MMQLEIPVAEQRIDPLLLAVHWKQKNPHAYMQIVRWAEEDMMHDSRPSIGLYAELLRRPHFASKLSLLRSDTAFLLNNNLRADLARLVMREFPYIEFQTREAAADRWEARDE